MRSINASLVQSLVQVDVVNDETQIQAATVTLAIEKGAAACTAMKIRTLLASAD